MAEYATGGKKTVYADFVSILGVTMYFSLFWRYVNGFLPQYMGNCTRCSIYGGGVNSVSVISVYLLI